MIKWIFEFATPQLGNGCNPSWFYITNSPSALNQHETWRGSGAGGARLTHTRQGVAELRVRDKLPVVESRHAVQVETV